MLRGKVLLGGGGGTHEGRTIGGDVPAVVYPVPVGWKVRLPDGWKVGHGTHWGFRLHGDVVGETVDRETTTEVGVDDPSAMVLRGGAESSSEIMIGLFLDAVSKQGKQDEHFQSLGCVRDLLLFSEVHFL